MIGRVTHHYTTLNTERVDQTMQCTVREQCYNQQWYILDCATYGAQSGVCLYIRVVPECPEVAASAQI